MEAGVKVRYLLSFWNRGREGAHEINPDLLAAQADSLGLPLIRTGFSSYEEEFKRAVRAIDEVDRKRGAKISSAVFGRIRTHAPPGGADLRQPCDRGLDADLEYEFGGGHRGAPRSRL
ncbi:hypothetical protein P0O24_07735 [Methanotrichaceae archaeon M04Ac]|jgi:hypothetical protein|uniref:Uncharacterized protein n=1 Tax=Candidatus Methanocrinis alkalitolerans TaxID=3033395 RepID=A0ABT5XFJ3_9EURY|nr:hypothetical protein [Candidatus Methanocrinis alkalitolerans]MDF0593471.1 hypothetical protein [Candidatus Methanocrinis alkalitolerans]